MLDGDLECGGGPLLLLRALAQDPADSATPEAKTQASSPKNARRVAKPRSLTVSADRILFLYTTTCAQFRTNSRTQRNEREKESRSKAKVEKP